MDILDDSVLDALKAALGDDAVVRQVVELYLKDAPGLLDVARKAHAASDATSLIRAAHTLKSTSASVGAMQVSAIAKDIEMRVKGGDMARPESLLAGLDAALGTASIALKKKIG